MWHVMSKCLPGSLQDPVKKPLLKKLSCQSEEVQQKACQAFLDILLRECGAGWVGSGWTSVGVSSGWGLEVCMGV